MRSQASGTPTFAGRILLIHMDNGTVFRNTYTPDGTHLHYETVAGPMTGVRGDVTLHSAEVAPGIFIIGWVEQSGTTVTHTMNFGTSTVHALVTHQTNTGRIAEMHTATIEPA